MAVDLDAAVAASSSTRVDLDAAVAAASAPPKPKPKIDLDAAVAAAKEPAPRRPSGSVPTKGSTDGPALRIPGSAYTPGPRPSVAAMAFGAERPKPGDPRMRPGEPGSVRSLEHPLQPPGTAPEREHSAAAATTALQTAGDVVNMGTLGGALAGAALRDQVAWTRKLTDAEKRGDAKAVAAELAQVGIPLPLHAVTPGNVRHVLGELVRGRFSPGTFHRLNEEYSTFGPGTMRATGAGPALERGLAAAHGPMKNVTGTGSAIKAVADSPLVPPPFSIAAKIANAIGQTDPKVAESAVAGTAEFAASLVGPGNQVPALLARGARGAGALAARAARARAPKAAEAVSDALGTAPITGHPYHELLRDVAPQDAERARALGRLWIQAPQAAKGRALPLLRRAFDGVPPEGGDKAAHRIIDAYQAGAWKKVVDAASDEDRVLAAQIRARHAEAVAAGQAVSPRVRDLADSAGHVPRWLEEAIPQQGVDKAARDAAKAERLRVLNVANAMEHAERMPENLTPDEIRRAGILSQNRSVIESMLARHPQLLDDQEKVPGYFGLSGAWRFHDEVPGAPLGGNRRELAVNTSYRNPARYQTVAEARLHGPEEIGSAPFSNLSPRQVYLLEMQRKIENVQRQSAYEQLGRLHARTAPGESPRFLREMPSYEDVRTGKATTRKEAIKSAVKTDTESARAQALHDMGIEFPDQIPKRRPPLVTGGHVRAVRVAAGAADRLADQAGRDSLKTVDRMGVRAAREGAAADKGMAGISETVQRGTLEGKGAAKQTALDVAKRAQVGLERQRSVAERVRKAVLERVSREFKPTGSRLINQALLLRASERLSNPAYTPRFVDVENAAGNYSHTIAVRKGERAKGITHDSQFTLQDAKELRAFIISTTRGKQKPDVEQVMDWLHLGMQRIMEKSMKLPPEYRSAVAPNIEERVGAAAAAVERAAQGSGQSITGTAVRGAQRTMKTLERGEGRTLRAVDRERLRTGKLRETMLSANVGDVDRILERVQRNAGKFTDRHKSTLLARDLAHQRRAVLDELEARIEARRSSMPRSGQDLITHVPGYSKVSDLGLGIKDEPDAQVIDGLRRFLSAKRVPPDLGTPVAEGLSALNTLARSSLVFNPVIHSVDNQGSIYLAATGDAKGFAEIIGSLTLSRSQFDALIRNKAFSSETGDTLRAWDLLSQKEAAWHPTTFGGGRMGTEAGINRTPSGAIDPRDPYHAPPGAERGDFATVATTDLRDVRGNGRLATLRARAEKIGYELQRWNSEIVFDRGERIYAAYLMRHFVKREGMSPAEAANAVRDHLGTDMLTEGERKFSRNFFFYPWVKTVIGLSARMGIARPQTWNAPLEGTRVQRETVGADDVRMSRSNPYTVAAPNEDGFAYYGLPIFNRILEPLARAVSPPESPSTFDDRFGPLTSYLTGHLAPPQNLGLRGAWEAINPEGVPDYLRVVDPHAAPADMFGDALRSGAESVFYPARAIESTVNDPKQLLPALAGGTVGQRSGAGIEDTAWARHRRLVRDLQRMLKSAERYGDQRRAEQIRRDLDYQRGLGE